MLSSEKPQNIFESFSVTMAVFAPFFQDSFGKSRKWTFINVQFLFSQNTFGKNLLGFLPRLGRKPRLFYLIFTEI